MSHFWLLFPFNCVCDKCSIWFLGQTWAGSLDQTLEQYGAYEVIDWIVQHLSRHPFLAFGMSICVLSCALPFIIFMVFAIATVIMTFTGFVIIEGQWPFSFICNFILFLENVSMCMNSICRDVDYIGISVVIWILRRSHHILFVLRFRNDGGLLWTCANLWVGRLSQQTACRCSVFPSWSDNNNKASREKRLNIYSTISHACTHSNTNTHSIVMRVKLSTKIQRIVSVSKILISTQNVRIFLKLL